MNLRPIKNNVIIEPVKEVRLASGLYIPANVNATQQLRGVVVAVGGGTKKNPMMLKVGDSVMYRNGVGTEMLIEGKDLLHLNEAHIISVL